MLINYLKITWKVLKRKRIYTIVTMAGIIIPVTFIVLITSFLVHLNNYNPPKSGFKKVVFLDRVTWKEIKEDGTVNQTNRNPPNYSFIHQYVKPLNAPKLVSAVSANSRADIIYLNDKPNEVFIKYSDSEFWEITDFKFIHGRPFNKSEFDQGARVVVLDAKTAYSFFGITNVVGKNLELKNKLFRIVGVVENVDITMHRIVANMYIPFSCNDGYLSKSLSGNWARALILTARLNDYQKINVEFQHKLKTMSFEGRGNINHVEASFRQDNYLERIKGLANSFLNFGGDADAPLYIASTLLVFFSIIY